MLVLIYLKLLRFSKLRTKNIHATFKEPRNSQKLDLPLRSKELQLNTPIYQQPNSLPVLPQPPIPEGGLDCVLFSGIWKGGSHSIS